MNKLYRVARLSGGNIKREDILELSEDQVRRIADYCSMKKEGYALDEKVLVECLDLCVGNTAKYTLFALLIDVRKGFQIVVFI